MSDTLRLTPAQAKAQADVFLNCSQFITDDIMRTMASLADDIRDGWKGISSETFATIMETDGEKALTSMSKLCFNTSDELNKIAQTMETFDQDTANAYSGN